MAEKKRMVRMVQRTKAAELEVQARPRTAEQVVMAIQDSGITKVGESLSSRELSDLIDYAQSLDEVRKDADKIVKLAKGTIMANAKKNKWKHLLAGEAEAKISPSTGTTIDPTEFVKLLAKLQKQKLFPDLMSVKVGEAKKYLGEDVLEDCSTISTEEFGSLSLKKVKKLKP